LTVSSAVSVTPEADADTLTNVVDVPPIVLIVKVADVLPAAIVTVAGTVAAGSLEDTAITVPPLGAGSLIVIVPVTGVPPITVVGLMVKETGTARPSTRSASPLKFSVPQPDAVSHPGPALESLPFGSVPLLPDTISLKTIGSPL